MDKCMNLRAKNLSADQRRALTVQTVIDLAAEHDPGEITTAANALVGRFCSRSGAQTSSMATASAPTTPVICVLAPAASATGVREELLLIGKP